MTDDVQSESAVERGGIPEQYLEVADESDYRIPPGCPHCDKSARAYYVGDVGMTENNVFVTGWVCVACETPISLYTKGKGGDFVDERPDLDCLDNIETPRDDDTEQSELVTDGGEPEMKSIECPNCAMPYTVPEEADHWSCDCGASWELDPRTDGGHHLGAECDVDDCESRVVGLSDGWEVSRGTVCQDCLDYRDRHGHWPDEDPEICVECRLDEGAIRHECDEAAVDAVILNRGSACDYCGFEANVATDGGRVEGDTEVPQKDWIESLLESLAMVEWDRFVRAEDDCLGVYFDIYGWIDREEDGYKDFILLRVFPETDENLRMFTTSSDRYHAEINEILFGETAESNHCQRVEHTFEVPNVVELDEREVATDGGADQSEAVNNAANTLIHGGETA